MFDRGSAPTWLFSFVDLAFLLLIAVTQMGVGSSAERLAFGELEVPRIQTQSAEPLAAAAAASWQLRVHAHDADVAGAFELVSSGRTEPPSRLDVADLHIRLGELRYGGAGKPVVAPHAEAYAADLLAALGAVEDRWPADPRFATVAPVSARR